MPSVAEILGLPSLSLEGITVPRPDAQARWVTTSELADPSPFLEGGEILLTTGLVHRDDAQWRGFVAQLLEAGVVALGFGVGLSHPDVPSGLRAAATDLALNLFSVPRPVPFIAVGRAVADLLWAAERESDREALLHQQQLTTAAIGGPAELVGTLARIVGGDAVLCSPDGSAIAGWPAAGLLQRAQPHIARMNAVGVRGAAVDIVRDSRVSVLPVGVGTHAEAYLAVEGEAAAAGAQRAAIATAVALLTLDRVRARAELEADRRIRAGALSLALQSDLDAARLLLDGTSPRTALPTTRARVVRARGTVERLDRALAQLERSSADLGHPLVAISGEHLVVILPEPEELVATVVAMLDRLEVGVGPVAPMSELAQGDEAARHALDSASAARPVVVWADLASGGVHQLLDAGALHSFATGLLGAVLSHPDADDLVTALRAFLTHNGHAGPAAVSLGIHRNTLRNRLATAESLMGRSLHDPQLRADLWVALQHLMPRASGSKAL